jgi:hypothetical protein
MGIPEMDVLLVNTPSLAVNLKLERCEDNLWTRAALLGE